MQLPSSYLFYLPTYLPLSLARIPSIPPLPLTSLPPSPTQIFSIFLSCLPTHQPALFLPFPSLTYQAYLNPLPMRITFLGYFPFSGYLKTVDSLPTSLCLNIPLFKVTYITLPILSYLRYLWIHLPFPTCVTFLG